jgi:hypothetical protein
MPESGPPEGVNYRTSLARKGSGSIVNSFPGGAVTKLQSIRNAHGAGFCNSLLI